LVNVFADHKVPYSKMVETAQPFYDRYTSYRYRSFLDGVALGSGLSADDVNILNGMETISGLISVYDPHYDSNRIKFSLPEHLVHCAFISIPPAKTQSGYSIIGRNYDFPSEIYGAIAANLTITVINDEDAVPTAIIGMPGQIYCPSCTNKAGLFMELNNGEPSGGYYLAQRESMLINMLDVMQQSSTLSHMHDQMMALQSDYSLIISTGNQSYAQSYEYSSNSTLGMKEYSPVSEQVLVYTNFYLNSTWGNEIPEPTDATTWVGVTRRDNLLNLASKSDHVDLDSMKSLMETPLKDGGAYWDLTIYQIIFQPENNEISIRRSFADNASWVDIDLDEFYNVSEHNVLGDTL